MVFQSKGRENKGFCHVFVLSNMKLVCKVTKPYSLLFRILPFRQEKNQGRFNSIAIVNLFPQSAMELCKIFVMHKTMSLEEIEPIAAFISETRFKSHEDPELCT